jgi:hypothetical protein
MRPWLFPGAHDPRRARQQSFNAVVFRVRSEGKESQQPLFVAFCRNLRYTRKWLDGHVPFLMPPDAEKRHQTNLTIPIRAAPCSAEDEPRQETSGSPGLRPSLSAEKVFPMADQWYYARAAGRILPTDTIWKEGIEKGFSAVRVKNLLPPTPAPSSAVNRSALSTPAAAPSPPPIDGPGQVAVIDPGAATPHEEVACGVAVPPETSVSMPAVAQGKENAPGVSETPPPLPGDADAVSDDEPAPSRPPSRAHVSQPKKGRAVALKGAVLISQDGQVVQYRKKCCKCGHENASKHRMPIRNGVTRASFFCPKCRKLSPVQIQGML